MNSITTNTNIEFKPSAFSHFCIDGNEVILYNSLYGVNSLNKYVGENKAIAIEYMQEERIANSNNPVLQSLINNKYVVPFELNEKMVLNKLFLKFSGNSILHLVILPTEQCNFRCKYCYENFNRGRMPKEIIDSIILFVRKNIHRYSGLKVSWFGGEPSLEIDTICDMSQKFIQICKTAKRKYWANITSNGYLIDINNFKKLYQSNIFTYQITIDGIESTHDQQRVLGNGNGSFGKIIDNLLQIKHSDDCKHWQIILRTNFSKPIYEHIDEYISFYNDIFGDDNRFSFFFRPAGDWGGERVKAYSDNLLHCDGFDQIFLKLREHEKTLNISRHISFINPGGSMCLASNANTFLIDSSGQIRKCTCHLDDKNNCIGQVNANGLFELDQYKESEWLKGRWDSSKCHDCFFLPSCLNAACPANYVLSRGDTNICRVYEKKHLDSILKVFNKNGWIPEASL